nr:hypothetical protein [Tanacetum cinerariifolium]
MAAAKDIDEIEEVNANCILMANLHQSSTSGTQTDKAPIYASDETSECRLENLNEVKDTIVTLQSVIKHRMDANITNWSSSAYQEFQKIIKDEIDPIVNQVDARVQNFENHFIKKATKFVRYFKSLENKADESLDKISILEKENERLLRAVVNQDIMSIVQRPTVIKTSDLQTELERERMWILIQNEPYMRRMILDPDGAEKINGTMKQIFEPLSKMAKGKKKQYIADVKVMNYLLQAIPNDIYNLVDSCKNAKEMWERIKRLMFSYDVTSHVRHSHLMDEFDKFAAKEGESLESVYGILTTLLNIMVHNNVCPIPVSINTKFLNVLQPEWSKYVTMVRHNQTGDTVSYDMLYDSLVQSEPHVLASKAKKAAKNHDPLALIAHSNASSSQSHANSSYLPQPYYVTHHSLVVDYEDEYQGGYKGILKRTSLNCHDVIIPSNHSKVLHTYQ